MRAFLRLTSIFLVLGVVGLAYAEDGARALFLSHKADGLKVKVLQDVGGTMTPVDPTTSFHKGDQITVELESNFTGYVYVINVTPGGKARVMFPQPEAADNRVRPGIRYQFPPGNNRMEFDAESGTETLLLIMCRNPIPRYEQAIKGGGEVAIVPTSPLSIEGGFKIATAHREFAAELHSRGLFFTQAATREAYVTVSPSAIKGKPETDGKLATGQTAIFELHLHHR